MGSLYRSEEMTLSQLFLQSEAAYACVSELGELGLVQFRDLNPDVNVFQRKFVNEVRRCEEMERKLRFLEKEIKKDGIPILDTGDNPDAPAPREMIDLEATFEKLENEMKEVNANAEALKRNFLELTELKHILRKAQNFFEEQSGGLELTQLLIAYGGDRMDDTAALLGEEIAQEWQSRGPSLQLGFVAGVILRERMPAFERMLWRACRGNVFLKQVEIDTPLEDPVTGDQVNKSVFIIFFQGDQLKSRVKKICEGFRATLYPCPETPAERREMSIGVMTRIEDLNTVLGQTQDHRHRVLMAAAKNMKVWFIKVCKIKAIYHTLNMCNLDVTQKCLIAECWCPVTHLDKIQMALRRGTERSGSSMPSILNRMATRTPPPTYNRLNKFTSVFQHVVDAYGVSSYREVNPAPFTIITFPFLFSVMFGDLGHGIIMFLAALWMVLKEKSLRTQNRDSEIWQMFFGGRYIILLMGAFSIYSGFLYNDVFSKSFNIFGSSWSGRTYGNATNFEKELSYFLNPNIKNGDYSGSPYPFGVDPIWQFSQNKISLLNSLKMKLSVILGVIHMMFGVILSLSNHRFFQKPVNIFCEFIPQLIFLTALFFYLVILIFFKWVAFDASHSAVAPSLLIQYINMFLFMYPESPESSAVFYHGQKAFQTFLVVLAVICVPWMLLVKPFILRAEAKGKITVTPGLTRPPSPPPPVEDGHEVGEPRERQMKVREEEEKEELPGRRNPPLSVNSGDILGSDGPSADQNVAPPPAEEEPEFDFSEVFIHQAIHTIEYCLGCISHTASYLRLWALSLAHSKLSEVLWQMIFRIGLSQTGYAGSILTYLLFAPWAFATIGILLFMEGLSAFLHTLRLHWVEFQSKFYGGEGYLFQPFSFDHILDIRAED